MNIPSVFKLERYFAKYEFKAPYLLSCSDCEPLTLKELRELSDEQSNKLLDDLWLGYTESQGSPLLRKEIAKLYDSVKPEEVLTAVPAEGIFLALNSFLKEGDHVIAPFPAYQTLYEYAQVNGCNVTLWKPDPKTWKFSIDDVRKAIKDNTRLIVINFPHNPTGAMITNDELHELVELAREKGIYIFSDEMYRFLEHDSKDRLDCVGEIYEKGAALCGLSKTFGAPGLRAGWIVTKNAEWFKKMAALKDFTSICSSAPSEVMAIMILRIRDKLIQRNLEIIKNNSALLADFCKRYPDMFSVVLPKAASLCFVEYKGSGTIEDFAQKLIDKKGVMILPSSVYDYPGPYFRVGLGRKDMPEVLSKVEDFINNQ